MGVSVVIAHQLLCFLRIMHASYSSAFNSVPCALTFHSWRISELKLFGVISTTSKILLATIYRDKNSDPSHTDEFQIEIIPVHPSQRSGGKCTTAELGWRVKREFVLNQLHWCILWTQNVYFNAVYFEILCVNQKYSK